MVNNYSGLTIDYRYRNLVENAAMRAAHQKT